MTKIPSRRQLLAIAAGGALVGGGALLARRPDWLLGSDAPKKVSPKQCHRTFSKAVFFAPFGTCLQEHTAAIENTPALHQLIDKKGFAPILLPISNLPLDIKNILSAVSITLGGKTVSAYDFVRDCVDEIIFSPAIAARGPKGKIVFPAGAILNGNYRSAEVRPGKRVVLISTLHPADLLAQASSVRHARSLIAGKNKRGNEEFFHQIVHEAGHKFIQKLVEEGRLSPAYTKNIDRFEKAATAIQRLALLGLCKTLKERFGHIPGVEERIAHTQKLIKEQVELKIRSHNRALGYLEDDWSILGPDSRRKL